MGSTSIDVYIRLPNRRRLERVQLPSESLCSGILRSFPIVAREQSEYFLQRNGLYVDWDDAVVAGETLELVRRLRGGKGGFGSMLRAIGAQIEKTTNREACRDLSGRRLRAINDEKR